MKLPTVQPIRSRGKGNVINRLSSDTYARQIGLIWKFFLETMIIAMNAFLFITYGFTCFIFSLSLLLIKAFNTMDLKDLLSEFTLQIRDNNRPDKRHVNDLL
jgi:hypothetical protein